MTSRIALAVAMVTLAPALVLAQSEDAVEAARTRYREGVQLFEANRFAEAYAAMHASLALVDSPNSRLLEARTLLALGRPDDAATDLEIAIRESREPRYDRTRDAARSELASLQSTLGRVMLSISPAPREAQIRIGSRLVSTTDLNMPIYVRPGAQALEVSATGFDTWRQPVSVSRGRTASIVVVLHPREGERVEGRLEQNPASSAEHSPVRSLEVADRPDVDVSHQDPLRAFEPSRTAWIAFAAGASGLALSAVFDVITNTEYDSLAASCSPMCGQAQTAAGRAEQVVTDVALAVGVAGIVVGASLWAARIVTGSRPRSTAFVGVGSVGVHF